MKGLEYAVFPIISSLQSSLLCRNWHLFSYQVSGIRCQQALVRRLLITDYRLPITEWLPKRHRAGPSASLDKIEFLIYAGEDSGNGRIRQIRVFSDILSGNMI